MGLRYTEVKESARAYASRVAANYPDNNAAWGIAYDAYISGSDAVVANSVVIDDDLKVKVERLICNRYTTKGIAKALGVDYEIISDIRNEIKQKEKWLLEEESLVVLPSKINA